MPEAGLLRGQVLVVDDDPDILGILKDNLEMDGFEVGTATCGRDALHHFEVEEVGLIILDLALPDLDGIQVCRYVRAQSSVPIIMLTARDTVSDKVLGLETGADDYLVKPFAYLELAARIKACMRRTSAGAVVQEVLDVGDIRLDLARKHVSKRGEAVELTNRQFDLLALLAANADRAMSRNAIRSTLWPDAGLYRDSRAIDVHVQHLRSKLEDDPSDPRHLVTVPGVGYMLVAVPA